MLHFGFSSRRSRLLLNEEISNNSHSNTETQSSIIKNELSHIAAAVARYSPLEIKKFDRVFLLPARSFHSVFQSIVDWKFEKRQKIFAIVTPRKLFRPEIE